MAKVTSIDSNWQPAAVSCLGSLIVVTVLLWSTVTPMVSTWYQSTTFNHCFLVIPLAGYLAWERRKALYASLPKPSVLGLALVALAGMVWLLGNVGGALVVEQIGLVLIAQSVVVATLGVKVSRVMLLPLFYLFFAVPIGDVLIPPLQTIAALFAVGLAKMAGLPVRADGLQITVANSRWVVSEACSGVRFLIATVALAVLLCGTFLLTWRRRLVLLAVGIALPIIANGLRVFAIMAIGYFTDNATAAAADHLIYGFVLFSVITVLIIVLALAMREAEPLFARRKLRSSAPAVSRWRFAGAAMASLAIIIVFGAAATHVNASQMVKVGGAELEPVTRPPWVSVERLEDPSPPRLAGVKQETAATYQDGTSTIFLHIGYFAGEKRGAEVVSSSHRFDDPLGTVVDNESRISLSVDRKTIDVRTLVVKKGMEYRVVGYWYWVSGHHTGNPYIAKLLQLEAKLFSGERHAAIITIASDYVPSRSTAAQALASFAASLHLRPRHSEGMAAMRRDENACDIPNAATEIVGTEPHC